MTSRIMCVAKKLEETFMTDERLLKSLLFEAIVLTTTYIALVV